MLGMTRLENRSNNAKYGIKIGTTGITVPSNVLIYPCDERIAKEVTGL